MRKPRLREVKSLVQGHPESLWSIFNSKEKASADWERILAKYIFHLKKKLYAK